MFRRMGAQRAFAARTSASANDPYSWQIVTAGQVYHFAADERPAWRSQLCRAREAEEWIIDDIGFGSTFERQFFELDFGLRRS